MSSAAGGPDVQPISQELTDRVATPAAAIGDLHSADAAASPATRHAPSAGVWNGLARLLRAGPEGWPSGEPATVRWLRRAVAIAAPILAVNSIFTAFADDMPASHHFAALIAAPVFVAAWLIELSGVPWPRLALIAAVVVPNLWLTLIGHSETNYLFLALLVGWVAFTGTRGEGLIALGSAWLTVVLGTALSVPEFGGIPWQYLTEWTFNLVLTWFLGFSLRRQERLVTELDRRSQQLEHRGQELTRRGQELEMLLTVSGSVASTLEMRQLLNTVFDALSRVVDYSAIAALTLNETRDTLTVAARRETSLSTLQDGQRTGYPVAELGPIWNRLAQEEPIVIPDVRGGTAEAAVFRGLLGDQLLGASNTFTRSFMWVPLVVRGQIIGIFTITSASPLEIGARETSLALAIARQAAVAIENTRLLERAGRAAVLEERQRLSRELHDSVTQALYGISLYAEAATRALAGGSTEPVATNLREISETTQEALGEMRLLLFELRPPLLQEQGLAAALRSRLQTVEARAGLRTEFECEDTDRLPPESEQELYRLVQEALNNVLKHAHAGRVSVRLGVANGMSTVEVADDGVGFEPSVEGAEGFGLRGMRERVERLGGTLRIDSSPRAGTRVRVEVPR